jgi:hypothetical protein
MAKGRDQFTALTLEEILHFFKWEFLKMGWRVHYSATVECKVLVFENRRRVRKVKIHHV